jgi:uncharacterized membrane protein YfhO
LENECGLDRDSAGQLAALAPVSQSGASVLNSPCDAEFKVMASPSRYFVFDECFAPGWHAWVDGRPTPILRANGLWMAVDMVSAGTHDVSFQYSPLSFRLGLFVTLIALAGFVFLLLNFTTETQRRS